MDSESSEIDDSTKAWEVDPRSLTVGMTEDTQKPLAECGIGHRVQASRSVLALVLDDECVFAGLQGGDIVVSIAYADILYSMVTDGNRPGLLILMTFFSPYMPTRRVSWDFIHLRMVIFYFPAAVILLSMYDCIHLSRDMDLIMVL